MSDDVLRDLMVSFFLFVYGLILTLILGKLDPVYEVIFARLF